MGRANYYVISISTRHKLLVDVMKVTQGSRRRSQFITSCVEAYLATEEGKKKANLVMEAMGQTKSEATEPTEAKKAGQLGFDLDSLLS